MALRAGETTPVARVDDLDAMAASSSGKIEIESLDDGGQGAIFDHLVRGAVLTVFKERVAPDQTRAVIAGVRGGRGGRHRRGRAVAAARRPRRHDPGAARPGRALTGGDESPAAVAAAVAFVLEGLHLSKRLNKDTSSDGWAAADVPRPLTAPTPR